MTPTFDALGHRFTVSTPSKDLDRWLGEALAPLATRAHADHRYDLAGADPHVSVLVDGAPVLGPALIHQALSYLLWQVNSTAVAESTGKLLLHAAAASLDGQMVILPAPTGSGKSTLVAALVATGFTYVTDEVVAVDPDTLAVTPYPRPIKLEGESRALMAAGAPPAHLDGWFDAEWHVPASALGGVAAETCAPPALMVSPRHEPGASTITEPLSRAVTATTLAANSFNFASDGRRWLPVVGRLAERCAGFTLTSADVDEACSTVRDLLGAIRHDPAPPRP